MLHEILKFLHLKREKQWYSEAVKNVDSWKILEVIKPTFSERELVHKTIKIIKGNYNIDSKLF